MDPDISRSWERFLDPDKARPCLIAASVYIAAFEALKDCVVNRIRDFFLTEFNGENEIVSPRYATDVLRRHKSPVCASLDWLKEHGAIDEADITTYDRVKSCRNVLAHELLAALGTHGLPPDYHANFSDMVALLRKIEVWWIMNVEIPTNPDYDGQEIDEEEVVPGSIMTLRILLDIAFGDEKTSRFYVEEFRKRLQNG